MSDIEYVIVKEADRNQLIMLYKDAGWWSPENDEVDPAFVDKIIIGSFCFVIAVQEKQIVGMGRCISDGVSDAYIQDVVVLQSLRGKGIGKGIINKMIDFLTDKGLTWIGLISEPGAEHFYESLNFKIMENYTPYLWKGKL
ncbi:MAG TPA: GNAT family N-acetyltransferase [Candidatus Cloacimonadota bacterium]|nr:GNAT family N-acetyltransferase [Candidatus Cloacimonadota bacterium]